jgi:hypothetical protein
MKKDSRGKVASYAENSFGPLIIGNLAPNMITIALSEIHQHQKD